MGSVECGLSFRGNGFHEELYNLVIFAVENWAVIALM